MGNDLSAATRRDFLASGASLALASLLANQATADNQAASGGERAGRARRVIWLFMHGGPSHVDLLDPKPELRRLDGQALPDSFGAVETRRNVAKNPLLGPIARFRPRGESGLEISDLLPETAELADHLCVLRSLHGDSVNHPQSVYQLNTGGILMGRPSVGAWVTYGLGSENDDLPGFVVLPDPGGGVKGGPPAWGSGFLPATFQGTPMRGEGAPILDLSPPAAVSAAEQRGTLEFLRELDQAQLARRDGDHELEARIRSYELALRMSAAAPELVDLGDETAETLRLYGIDQPATAEFGRRCLLARRMVERGVRFVQLYSGNTEGWDAHQDVRENHGRMCRATDRPVAGLLRDLARRGLLDDTLVIWGGEFGRMPMSEQGKGRDHNPWGYSAWLAGAGVRGGLAYGATDPVGLRAVEHPIHVRDFHATLLHLLGLDYERLTFMHRGLEERLTGPQPARVVTEVLA